jgi:hypothetical protein
MMILLLTGVVYALVWRLDTPHRDHILRSPVYVDETRKVARQERAFDAALVMKRSRDEFYLWWRESTPEKMLRKANGRGARRLVPVRDSHLDRS